MSEEATLPLIRDQGKEGKHLKSRCRLIDELVLDKGLGLRVIKHLAKTLHQEFRTRVMHPPGTPRRG